MKVADAVLVLAVSTAVEVAWPITGVEVGNVVHGVRGGVSVMAASLGILGLVDVLADLFSDVVQLPEGVPPHRTD